MTKAKILFINQETIPYMKESTTSLIGRYLPQFIQDQGKEIRTFMPRFGIINERRNQLHEVIRLSGINLIIENQDHPLIIKVASIQPARMQVYFIDNEDFFQKKFDVVDSKNKLLENNDERVIFFSRGVLETIKKLNWRPAVIQCNGWFSCLLPFYIKRTDYKNNPLFSTSKVVISLIDDDFGGMLQDSFAKKLKTDGGTLKDWKMYKEASYLNYMKAAISYADGVVAASDKVNPELISYVKELKKPFIEYASREEQYPLINALYDKILINEEE